MCVTLLSLVISIHILIASSFFHALYMTFTELVTAKKSEGEVLVFRRGYRPSQFKESKSDAEIGTQLPSGILAIADKADGGMSDKESGAIQETTSVFHWR